MLLDPWSIDWVIGESHGAFSNLHHLGVDSLCLGGSHTDGPEFDVSTSDVSFSVVSVLSGIVLEIPKGLVQVVADGFKFLVVVAGLNSLFELSPSILGVSLELSFLSHELSLVVSLFIEPLVIVWHNFFIDELSDISSSLEGILLESLEGGSINDLVGVWCNVGGIVKVLAAGNLVYGVIVHGGVRGGGHGGGQSDVG
jgi:hypothetical protein